MLGDDLQLKAAPGKARQYPEAEFAKAPEAIELRASVDAKSFRVGDPIRLDLELENHSKSPYSVVLPHLPSGWSPTMAYGIRLTRGTTVLLDLAPSDFYQGSYSGPPPFQAFAPGEVFRSHISLQSFLRGEVDLPLPEGEYELVIAFDSSKFADIRPVGVQLVHRWEARPVKFTIKGEARDGPGRALHLIGQKSGLPWIEDDLLSPQLGSGENAWRAVFEFGDSRLSPLVEKFEREHPKEAATII